MSIGAISNRSPFAVETVVLNDESGRFVLVVLTQAVFRIIQNDAIVLLDDQPPIELEPVFRGEPGKTSLLHAPQIAYTKLGTDVSLSGTAWVPGGYEATQVDVSFSVGPVSKMVRVFGDRFWVREPPPENVLAPGDDGEPSAPPPDNPWRLSDPQPFRSMPLTYERAFGGVDNSPEHRDDFEEEPRNLVGTGVIAKKSRRVSVALPNLEDPQQPIQTPQDRPAPACFDIVSPDWQPRRQYAGTYDDAWQQQRSPLLPKDFDRRFFNTAHPDLVCAEFLQGNERIRVRNASQMGDLDIDLPGIRPRVSVQLFAEQDTRLPVNMDSIHVDTDKSEIRVLWRASLFIDDKLPLLQSVTIKKERFLSAAQFADRQP